MVVYPESIPWGPINETVFAWMMDDTHKAMRNGRYMLSNRFTDIGIACDYHGVFGQFCVIEVGRNVIAGEQFVPEPVLASL